MVSAVLIMNAMSSKTFVKHMPVSPGGGGRESNGGDADLVYNSNRAFVKERLLGGQACGESLLYFGCRRSDQDYLYGSLLESWHEDGSIQLYTAFSREQVRTEFTPLSSHRATILCPHRSTPFPVCLHASTVCRERAQWL